MPNKIYTIVSMLKRKFKKVNKNKIVFTSFDGHYSDSPKYISIAIHKLAPDIEQVWLINEKYSNLIPDYATAININSEEATQHKISARAIVDNVYATRAYEQITAGVLASFKRKVFSWINKKNGQYIFTTWHGTPLKRMGRDQIGNSVYGFSCPATTMLLGNKFTLDIMRHLTFSNIKMKLIGCPRNDILFASDEKKNEIKERLGLPLDKKIVLFAPTFRTDGNMSKKNINRSGIDQLSQIDFDKLFLVLNKKFNGNFVFVGRFHYHVEQMINFDELNKKYPNKIINGNLHDDMAEYLAATDVLLTDASSSMFDFALTKRPCFLLFPDLTYYKDSERGFYLDINTLPFPCSKNFDELCNDILNFNPIVYENKIDEMLSSFGYVDDEGSSERIANYILKKLKKGNKK